MTWLTRFHPHKAVQPENIILYYNRPVSHCFFSFPSIISSASGTSFTNRNCGFAAHENQRLTVNDLRPVIDIFNSKELLLCNSSQHNNNPGCVFRQTGLSGWHVRQLPQCPGGRPLPEGCRKRGSGMVFAKGEPEVWPCSCAARWQVHSGKPQSGNTFPLSPGCKTRCNCPGDKGHTGGSEWGALHWDVGGQKIVVFSRSVAATNCFASRMVRVPSSSCSLTLQLVSSPASSTPLWR